MTVASPTQPSLSSDLAIVLLAAILVKGLPKAEAIRTLVALGLPSNTISRVTGIKASSVRVAVHRMRKTKILAS